MIWIWSTLDLDLDLVERLRLDLDLDLVDCLRLDLDLDLDLDLCPEIGRLLFCRDPPPYGMSRTSASFALARRAEPAD